MTRVRRGELGDEAYLPVFEAIDGLGLPLFLHPVHVVDPERLARYYLTNLLGNPMESGIAAAHLIFSGVLDRFSNLDVCLPHAGGVFPYVVGRLQHGHSVRPEMAHRDRDKGPMEYIRRFHYDTVSHSGEGARLSHRPGRGGPGDAGQRLLFRHGLRTPGRGGDRARRH